MTANPPCLHPKLTFSRTLVWATSGLAGTVHATAHGPLCGKVFRASRAESCTLAAGRARIKRGLVRRLAGLLAPLSGLTAQHLLQVANHTAQRSVRFQQSLRQCSECPLFRRWSGQWTASDPIIEARLYQARRSQPKEDRLGPMLVSLGQGEVRIYSEAPTLPGRLLGISIVFHSHASPVYEKRCCSPKRGARKTRLPIFALMVYASRHAKAACVDEVHAARHIRQHACSPSRWLARAT
ncbi:hypothetical protein L1887_56810 [Cichorium endivia]|nr:hypothetical protein L1887_56810 [Cichorium endivia]